MDEEVRKEKGDEEFEKRKEELRRRDELKTSRNKAKRDRMKARKQKVKGDGGCGDGMEGVEKVEAGGIRGARFQNGLGMVPKLVELGDDAPVETPVSSEEVGVIIHDDE